MSTRVGRIDVGARARFRHVGGGEGRRIVRSDQLIGDNDL